MLTLEDRTQAVGNGEPPPTGESSPTREERLLAQLDSYCVRTVTKPPSSSGHEEAQVYVVLAELSSNRILGILGFVPSPVGVSTTFGGRSVATEELTEERQALINRRRLYLIDKRYGSGLTLAESSELGALQEARADYLNAVQPLPTGVLDQLQQLADQLEGEDATEIE